MDSFRPALERLDLGRIRVKTRGGVERTPFEGQSAWVFAFLPAAGDMETLRDTFARYGEGDDDYDHAAFPKLCGFIADEVDRIDAANPRDGSALAQPDSADAVASWPDSLVGHLLKVLLGAETEGEGGAGRAGLPGTSSETPAISPES